MYGYKADEQGNIIEELLDITRLPEGFIRSNQKLDASIHMILNGAITVKPIPIVREYKIELTNEQKLEGIRELRNSLLSATDWTQTLDAPISADLQAQYAYYRRLLRELPERSDLNLDAPIFPTKP